ncbi:hypothetical protein MBELCI_2723 [Limimaricola cinnabarinus LL-001]|uniref:Uncharacterized protein n=1 Tax=Limimaricola cinnabarinus LL-001 TaxID=1337093 RepID=U2YN36_9RHOB|nr:hypothetical protein MBELCI_2723 [Limimaricola cinnabarinus LL-001]
MRLIPLFDALRVMIRDADSRMVESEAVYPWRPERDSMPATARPRGENTIASLTISPATA